MIGLLVPTVKISSLFFILTDRGSVEDTQIGESFIFVIGIPAMCAFILYLTSLRVLKADLASRARRAFLYVAVGVFVIVGASFVGASAFGVQQYAYALVGWIMLFGSLRLIPLDLYFLCSLVLEIALLMSLSARELWFSPRSDTWNWCVTNGSPPAYSTTHMGGT